MKKHIAYILSAWLILGITFLVTEKVLSQTNEKEDSVETTDSVRSVPGETSAYVTGITPERAKSLVGGVIGLLSLVMGWRTKVRSSGGAGSKRTGAIVALVLGLMGILLSVVHLSTSVSAVFGSGSGKAGAIMGLALSLIGTTLGGLALRSGKTD